MFDQNRGFKRLIVAVFMVSLKRTEKRLKWVFLAVFVGFVVDLVLEVFRTLIRLYDDNRWITESEILNR